MNKYISKKERGNLSRGVYVMPSFISRAIKTAGVEKEYKARPAYQKNDYVGWIVRSKRPETQQKRLQQMIQELKGGTRYMKMKYKATK